MRHLKRFAGLFLVAAATASCGDVVREGRAPVFMVVDLLQGSSGGASAGTPAGFLLSDVITYVTTPAPCSATTPCPTIFNDSGSVTLRLAPKDIGNPVAPTQLSSNNAVTINRYHVTYRRADGRNTPGVDVPYGFDGAATGTVQVGGSLALGFELVRHVAKMESPLVQLTDSPTVISTIADVTFYGRDLVGNDVAATGSIQIDFGNFGDH